MPTSFSPWPLSDLRVTVRDLVLRVPTDAELGAFARAVAGERLAAVPPLAHPDDTPAERARRFMQDHWSRRGEWSPRSWALDLFAFDGGGPVGMQRVIGRQFATTRTVTTGSVVAPRRRGGGVGSAMRAAALHLAFETLGAEFATTAATADNAASLAVTARFGYARNGVQRVEQHGSLLELHEYRLPAARWRSLAHGYDVAVSGLDGLRPLFGLTG